MLPYLLAVLEKYNLMNDLFPNLSKLNKNQESIEKSINFATRELNYQIWPSQTEKIMQLYDQMLVRHGVMLVGPTGGGKTVARNILQKALTVLPTFEKSEHKQKAHMVIVSIENHLFIIILIKYIFQYEN